ncbi:MAG: type IV pilus twitching motility protein PilT [Polyangiales bacterium]
MKRLSVYVQHLLRYEAQSLVLASGAPVTARFAQGDRASNTPIDHAQLVSIVQEAAPPEAIAELRVGRPTRFVFDEGGSAVTVDVVPNPGAWQVTITPGVAGAPAPTPQPAPMAPPQPAARGQIRPAAVGVVDAAPAQPVAAPQPAKEEAHGRTAGAALAGQDFGPIGVDRWLRMLSQLNGSDLHLSCGNPPKLRLHGEIQNLEDGPILEHDKLKSMLFQIMPPKNREEFDRRRDTDWAYEIEGLARFRGNAFMDRRGIGAVFRKIPFEILSPEKLGLPRPVLDLCNLTKGLVVVTGPTGSGKSTTLATLVDVINQTRDDHIITIEDPIEFVHENKRCLVNQREVRVHTDSFKDALRAALREDPDIVLVGEMRDLETIAIAIETAETGHLVFGTLHTTTAPSTVDRIIDQFSPERQAQIRTMLSESLKGVIAQVLCKKIGGGRAAAYETLIGTPAVANLIREGKTFQLPGIMQTSRNVGMQTMNDSLLELCKKGLVDPKEAYMKAVNKSEMRGLLTSNGFTLPELGK